MAQIGNLPAILVIIADMSDYIDRSFLVNFVDIAPTCSARLDLQSWRSEYQHLKCETALLSD